MRKTAAFIFCLIPSASAWGHAGHGNTADPNSVQHYLMTPEHAMPWLLATAGAVLMIALFVRQVRRRKAMQIAESR